MNLEEFLAQLPKGDLWVFGYGSLMWSPGFSYSQKTRGRIHGYHRALCILSTRYRGTKRKPGLVMGLCRGGSCWGMAYRVHAEGVRRSRGCGSARCRGASTRRACSRCESRKDAKSARSRFSPTRRIRRTCASSTCTGARASSRKASASAVPRSTTSAIRSRTCTSSE